MAFEQHPRPAAPTFANWAAAVARARARLSILALRAVPTEAQRLLALTIAIGAVCGLVAVAFHEAIRLAEAAFLGLIDSGSSKLWILWSLIIPTGGALIAGALLARFFPDARGSGIPQVKASYAGKRDRVRLRDSVAKFFLAALQIGSGASLGREGPTVQICAGVATALGRLVRVSPQAQRKLLPVGAAAGIAAAFNAPIAAVTFTIEEIIGKLDETLLSGVIVAAALAAAIERSILGAHPVFDVPGRHGLDDARSLILYALLGVAAAGVSIAFCDLLLGLRRAFRSMRRLPPWAQPAVGGLVTGAIAVLTLLAIHTPGVTGGGYETLRGALAGELGVRVMLVLCVAKLVATCFSYSSGGAGGIFAPVLFIGAMLGGAFGWLDVTLFHHPSRAAAAFALVGMGAVFSGAIRAPMTSVLIIIEMTSGYELILPLMIANMSAYVIARRFRPQTIYEALLAQDGITFEEHRLGEALDGVALSDVVASDRAFVTFERHVRADEILRVAREPSWQTVFPVIDSEGRLTGIITQDELRVLVSEPDLLPLVNAVDLMRPPVTITVRDTLRRALERMRSEQVRELPVVDDENRVIGFVDEGALAHLYLRATPGPPSSRKS
ncbi:MAG TPA: chloride channel protein [Labilithrix sp.]